MILQQLDQICKILRFLINETVIHMINEFQITRIISSDNWDPKLEGLENRAAHAFALAGIDHYIGVFEVLRIERFAERTQIAYFVKVRQTRFIVLMVDDGACNEDLKVKAANQFV